ncbi:MAG: glycosyltransferase [Edaphocola sp.]
MGIRFFYRHPSIGFSIQHVFGTIENGIREQNATVRTKSVHVPSPGSMPWDVVRNCMYVFRHRNRKGINHITGHIHDVILGLLGCKTVLTVHDLVFLDNVKNPIKRFYKYLFWLYFPIKLADKVTCISGKTKKNIEKYIKTDKLVVIHNPVDPSIQYVPKKFNTEKPVILHIGTGWNKNLMRTVEALEDIPCHLRIIGKLSDETVAYLKKYRIEYSNGCHLTDEEIRTEYVHCDIVNFPSEYEGFGMPVIEGQKTGRIVLTSQIEPIVEVAGNDAVHFVNHLDVNSLREGYLRIINDDIYRNNLIKKGLENTQRFDVKEIAMQYLQVYKELNL